MSHDIEYFKGKYADCLDDIETVIAPLRQGDTPPDDASARIAEAEQALRSVAGVKKSYTLELRLLRDRTTRFDYERALEQLDARKAQLDADVQTAKAAHSAANDRAALLDGGTGAAAGVRHEGKTNDDYLKAAHKVQDQTVQSLDHTMQMIEASKEVGQATLEELARQREQIVGISDTVAGIEDNLTRADKLIRTFGKRMATDKCIQVFTIINLIMLVIIVVYAIMTKGVLKGGDQDDEEDADTPDAATVTDDAAAAEAAATSRW